MNNKWRALIWRTNERNDWTNEWKKNYMVLHHPSPNYRQPNYPRVRDIHSHKETGTICLLMCPIECKLNTHTQTNMCRIESVRMCRRFHTMKIEEGERKKKYKSIRKSNVNCTFENRILSFRFVSNFVVVFKFITYFHFFFFFAQLTSTLLLDGEELLELTQWVSVHGYLCMLYFFFV